MGATLTKPGAGVQPEIYIRPVVRQGIPGTLMPAWAAPCAKSRFKRSLLTC